MNLILLKHCYNSFINDSLIVLYINYNFYTCTCDTKFYICNIIVYIFRFITILVNIKVKHFI